MSINSQLQQLFHEQIQEIKYLDPGYSGHASDVWLVKTDSEEFVVRSSRLNEAPDHEFWLGCYNLFGIDPRRMCHFEANAAMVGSISSIPTPRVHAHKIIDGKEYLVVEKMNGEAPQSFIGQPESLLHQFGIWLAKVHLHRCEYFGNLAITQREPKESFHDRLSQTMRELVECDYEEDNKIKALLDSMIRKLSVLPVPDHFCPVFIDLDPSQFLVKDEILSAVVDVEAYAIGPREFDFIGLEYMLDETSAASFLTGYSTILIPPDISQYRTIYRYFYRLLGVQGSVDLDQWLAQKELF
ncbi:aminoglycoside phosphotransferase family protein [Lederbergia panacisoli]|uniref:aminoglycoside phosphotransferase family protein n=1 Tax=Lederbergia panacisoli TaxID=1255251 RepID=UPI00214A9FE5|nr:aminoglycoside phosphotransferase family protein [Lederbergia panacisoli]MCR2822771.1 aminoglycoside phosphotransferase family protein [Lederbergia panacisoli]